MRQTGPPRSSTVPTLLAAAALLLALPALAEAPLGGGASPRARALAEAARAQVGTTLLYDPAYVKLAYPGGDVPPDRGVCTDVLVRALRALGVDLQVELHRDMTASFASYPTRWHLARPDSNIDHRRVQNLETWMRRRGMAVPITRRGADYWPGDVVTVDVDGRAHLMVVSSALAPGGERLLIVHNIGEGAREEDRLFEFPLTGHYRPL